MGLLKLGHVSLDGTKVRANASKHKALSWGYAKRLEEQLRGEMAALLERAAQADEAEPELDIPEELKRRERRLAVIEAAQVEIERRARERFAAEQAAYEEKLASRREQERATGRKLGGRPPKAPEAGPGDKDQLNLTDGEPRIMPSPDGFAQCYNAQSAVDVESHLVVTADVSDECNDKRQVAPALEGLDGLPAALGKPVGLLADTGYLPGERGALRGGGLDTLHRHGAGGPQSSVGRAPCAPGTQTQERDGTRNGAESASLAAPPPTTHYDGACVDAVTGDSDTNSCSGSLTVSAKVAPDSGMLVADEENGLP